MSNNLFILKNNKGLLINLLKISQNIEKTKIHFFRKRHFLKYNKSNKNFMQLYNFNLNYYKFDKKIIQFIIFLSLKIDNRKLFELFNIKRSIYTYLKFFKYFYKDLNLIYKDFYYLCFIKKTRSNTFLTITNRLGDVIYSYSIGKLYFLKKRKKRKSIKSINFIIRAVSKKLFLNNIRYIYKLYLQNSFKRFFKRISNEFLKYNIKIKNLIYIKNKPHSLLSRSKKLRRI